MRVRTLAELKRILLKSVKAFRIWTKSFARHQHWVRASNALSVCVWLGGVYVGMRECASVRVYKCVEKIRTLALPGRGESSPLA